MYPVYNDSLVLSLQQNGNNVTGTIDLGGYPINASGSVNGAGVLQINGTGSSNGVEYEYKSWNTTISGSSMNGTFVFLEYLKSGGSAQYAMTLSAVVKSSN